MKKITIIISLALITVLVKSQVVPGSLNTNFGINGLSYPGWTDTTSYANGIGVLSNGRIIISANCEVISTSKNLCIATCMDNEGKSQEFGIYPHGYEFEFPFSNNLKDIHIHPDNKILLTGYYTTHSLLQVPYIIRLNSSGKIDVNFATNGIFTTDLANMMVMKMAVYITGSTYKIILCGASGTGNPMLIMVNESGNIETTFSSDGITSLNLISGIFTDVCVDNSNGHIYACAALLMSTSSFIAKYDLSGNLVTSFGDNGLSDLSIVSSNIFPAALLCETDSNRVAVFGHTQTSTDYEICATRVRANNGVIDSTFGVNGWSILPSPTSDEKINCAGLQSDGKYYFGGYSDYFGTKDFFVGRVKSNGFADNTFGAGGLVVTDLPGDQEVMGIALNPAQDILYATGSYASATVVSMLTAAYNTGYEVITQNRKIMAQNDISVFPNPVKDKVTVRMPVNGNYTAKIYDTNGKCIYQKKFEGNETVMNINDLSCALYILYIQSGTELKTMKLLKQGYK